MKIFQHLGLSTARWGVVAMMVAVPLSKALFNVALVLILVGWLASGGFREKLQTIFRSPTASAALLFLAALLASATYSSAPGDDIRQAAGVYLRLLIIPLIVSLILDEKWLQRCWVALIASLSVLLLHTYANMWFEIPWTRSAAEQLGNRGVFNAHMVQSVSLAFFVAVLLNRFNQTRDALSRWSLLLLATAAAFSITNLSDSRTGYLALLLALAIHSILVLPPRWQPAALLALVIGAGMIAWATPSISERVTIAYEQIVEYSHGINYSSVGSRIFMGKVATELTLQAPWFGHGLGAYPHLAEQSFSNADICSFGCQHPHNEYLFTSVQTGLVGLLLLLNLMFKPLRCWFKLGLRDSTVPVFVGLLALTAIPDGPIWFRGFAFFFIPVMGLLAADLRHRGLQQKPHRHEMEGPEGVSMHTTTKVEQL